MKRDHIGFFLFLLLMLIAPDIHIPGLGADASGPPMGAIGFVIWGILSPQHLTGIQHPNVLALPLSWALFGFYSLIVTLFPWNPATLVSVAYVSQNLFYYLCSFLFLSSYYVQAFIYKQLHVSMKILKLFGLIYAIAIIVSVITGPFYPQNVVFTARQWSGQFIQQGVGFSDSANGAGSMMMFFATLCFFMNSKTRNSMHWLLLSLVFIALVVTLSRSALYSFFVSLLLYALLRFFGTSGIDRRFFMFILGLIIFSVLALAFIVFVFPDVLPLLSAVREGLVSFDSDGIVSADKDDRLERWQQGIDSWLNGSLIQQLFGKGFRASSVLDSEGWISPHNLYVALLGDFGIVGLFIFLFPLARMIIALAIQVILVNNPGLESFAFVAMTSLLINNTTETYLYGPGQIVLMLLIMILGALELHYSKIFKEQKQSWLQEDKN